MYVPDKELIENKRISVLVLENAKGELFSEVNINELSSMQETSVFTLSLGHFGSHGTKLDYLAGRVF